MKDLKATRGRYYISRLIEEGEHQRQDFKFAINDAVKIARSLSAFANSDGGRLLVGVKDNGTIAGVRNEEDLYVIEQAATMCCEPEVPVEIQAYNAGDGLHVFKVDIPAMTDRRPVLVKEKTGLKAYYRVADENIVAHPLMVSAWKMQNDDSRPALSLDEKRRCVLEVIDGSEGADGLSPERIALATHSSVSLTNSILAQLMASGLVEMRHNGNRWIVALVEPGGN